MISGRPGAPPSSGPSADFVPRSIGSATSDSDIEAFGVEFEEDDDGMPAGKASFMPVESGASSNVSCPADAD
jgi:hypothetical protein